MIADTLVAGLVPEQRHVPPERVGIAVVEIRDRQAEPLLRAPPRRSNPRPARRARIGRSLSLSTPVALAGPGVSRPAATIECPRGRFAAIAADHRHLAQADVGPLLRARRMLGQPRHEECAAVGIEEGVIDGGAAEIDAGHDPTHDRMLYAEQNVIYFFRRGPQARSCETRLNPDGPGYQLVVTASDTMVTETFATLPRYWRASTSCSARGAAKAGGRSALRRRRRTMTRGAARPEKRADHLVMIVSRYSLGTTSPALPPRSNVFSSAVEIPLERASAILWSQHPETLCGRDRRIHGKPGENASPSGSGTQTSRHSL